MKRKRIGRGASRRNFKRNANVHPMNSPKTMRGGYRL